MKTKSFLHHLDHDRIVAAIGEAEARSRGEVRVHVTGRKVKDPQAEARRVFDRLGMAATAERNGVLIYVAPESQNFAVIGDFGIHQRCGESFWSDVASAMHDDFQEGRFTEGLVKGVAAVGDALAREFPRLGGVHDPNELPDSVTHD